MQADKQDNSIFVCTSKSRMLVSVGVEDDIVNERKLDGEEGERRLYVRLGTGL